MRALLFAIAITLATLATAADKLELQPRSEGWTGASPREELRPVFSVVQKARPRGEVGLVIAIKEKGQQGWLQKSFPVEGGKYYSFEVLRRVEDVESPRRSAPVRIVWQDAKGRAVPADVPEELKNQSGSIPLAEPEHPLDELSPRGEWVRVAGTYRAPSKATQAIIELHLQWTAKGSVTWVEPGFTEVPAPAPRKVRLAAVHYVPSGKSALKNCEEYEPFIAEAAKQRADLVVLGETVPYVGLKKKPHETAEAIPGPTTEYFGKLAAKHKTHIAVSLYERDGKIVYNAAVLLGPDGELIGKYRKVCLPHSEVEAGVEPGEGYPVFQTKFGKVGLMICYDGFFPEVARELTNRGAEVIAWPVWGCNPLLAQARACENHTYLVSSTYTDAKNDWTISAIYDRAGKPIAKAEKWGSVAVAEVELGQPHFWRNNLGDFRSMVQRHRPFPVGEAK